MASLYIVPVTAVLLAWTLACSDGQNDRVDAARQRSARGVVRITGSDTMVNLAQAWAELYKQVRPAVSVQVAGGGSGVGIAGLIDGTVDIASASREMQEAERRRVTARYGAEPRVFTVAFDALALYVHKDNPLAAISLEELAQIYGEGGWITRWSQLGVRNPACRSDTIIRIGRQNNSGSYVYFRDRVLGKAREYKMGSIDQSGSKDVVALISRTPCAIGYSGMAFVTAGVKSLELSSRKGEPAAPPGTETVIRGSYPLARPLYLYTVGEPKGPMAEFLDWVLGANGRRIVRDIGFVPVTAPL